MQQNTIKNLAPAISFFDAFKANDDAVLKRFYKANYFKTEKYVLNNNGTTEHAKDIYQEAFIAVWRNIQLDKFYPENENSLEGYLFRIAKNKWLDHLRSAHYKSTSAMNGNENIKDDLLPEEDMEYINEVKNKFKNLGESCREVLIWFYYKKESLRAIAEKFEWTEATAKNNKYRCLQHLRELIKK